MDARIVEFEVLQSKDSSSKEIRHDFRESVVEVTQSEYLKLFRERQEIALLLGIESVRVGNLESSVDDLKLSLSQHSNELELIQNSRSWRYTKYLRDLRATLGRVLSRKR